MCLSVNNCCCCVTLDVGTKVISIICTVLSSISLLVYGSAAAFDRELPPSRLFFYAAITVVSLLEVGFGCLLICGAFAKKPSYTWPWTALAWSQALALVVLTVSGMVLLSYNREPAATPEISAVISFYFVYALFLFYSASVVNSRRQQMVIEQRSEAAQRFMGRRVLPYTGPYYA